MIWQILKKLICYECEKELKDLKPKYILLDDENKQLKQQIKQLQQKLSTLQQLQKENQQLQNKIIEYQTKITTLTSTIKQLQQRIEELQQMKTFNFRTIYKPSTLHKTTYQWLNFHTPATLIYADLEYYMLNLNDWKKVLKQLQKLLTQKYTKSVFDCDDFALVMASLVVQYAYAKKMDRQLAFAIAWSDVHTFNVFWTPNGKMYVFEPQTGMVVGEVSEIRDESYKVKKVMLIG